MSQVLVINLSPSEEGLCYKEILEFFQRIFDDTSAAFDVKAKGYIWKVLRDIISRHDWDWTHSSDTIETINGQAEYALAPDCDFLEGDMVIAGNTPVVRKPREYVFQKLARSPQSGTPKYVASTGRGTVLFWPTPSVTGTTILYPYTIKVPDDFTAFDDDSCPPMPASDQHVLITGVEYELRKADDRTDQATRDTLALYENQISYMIWREGLGEEDDIEPDIPSPEIG